MQSYTVYISDLDEQVEVEVELDVCPIYGDIGIYHVWLDGERFVPSEAQRQDLIEQAERHAADDRQAWADDRAEAAREDRYGD